MDKKRIFRLLVCLILVCCVLVHTSPIQAEAVATGTSVAGWTALMFFLMASGGIVLNAEIPSEPPAIIQQAEEALDNYVLENYEMYFPDIDPDNDDDTDLKQFWEDLKDGVNECFEKFGNFDNLSDFLPQETFADWVYDQAGLVVGGHAIGIGAKLQQLLAGWYMDIYDKGFFELGGSDADSGWAYFNGSLLPDFSLNVDSSYPKYNYRFIYRNNNTNKYYLSVSIYEASVAYDSYFGCNKIYPGRSVQFYYASGASQWNGGSSVPDGTAYILNDVLDLIWSSHDLYDTNGSLVFPGSAPSSTQTITVEPDLFFGDYADQKEAGTLSPSSFQFPLYDFSDYLHDQESVHDEMRQLHDQISNGQITYNDYIQNITYNDPGIDPGGSEGTDPSDPNTPSDIPEDIAGYTLDLKDFFPFCIPFDIYEFLSLLSAEPEAPRFEFTFNFGEYLGVHTLVIDLSQWDSTAQLLRRLELMLFIVGLAMATRNYYIRG